jgi:hypothetical protein
MWQGGRYWKLVRKLPASGMTVSIAAQEFNSCNELKPFIALHSSKLAAQFSSAFLVSRSLRPEEATQ